MTIHRLPDLPTDGVDATTSIIKIAILAVGGQGGGVLTDWVIDLAEHAGYRAQSTSVAGVAQRTGATIYYVEMTPDGGRDPVFSLSPAPGDVDILIAAELMEAGRAVMRGFVTPDRTTLIASAHRVLAVSEKIVPGDGRADAPGVTEAVAAAAHRLVCFDMEQVAVDAGSVISSSLFGALAGSGALPFEREAYEATIRRSGRGVEASLRAFNAACDLALAGGKTPAVAVPEAVKAEARDPEGPEALVSEWRTLRSIVGDLPAPVQDMAGRGLRKVVDYQDLAYGRDYLDHLKKVIAIDDAAHEWRLSIEAAKYIANALVYDDIIRVADLKTRASREARLRREQGIGGDAIAHVTEYFHPRMQEICGTLPVRLGRWIENSPRVFGALDKVFNRGRRIRTDGIVGFGMLYGIATLKPARRRLLRHEVEMKHMAQWLETALSVRDINYDLAVEVLKCRRLIKGYSDTHERGLSKYRRVMDGLPMIRHREDAADWLRRLREAALLDEEGKALDGALKTIETL